MDRLEFFCGLQNFQDASWWSPQVHCDESVCASHVWRYRNIMRDAEYGIVDVVKTIETGFLFGVSGGTFI